MSKTWVYHKTKDAKIVTEEEAEKLYLEGWADTPAAFKCTDDDGDVEIKSKPVAEVKSEHVFNLDEMSKAELVEYAWDKFSPEQRKGVSKRSKKEEILKRVKELEG